MTTPAVERTTHPPRTTSGARLRWIEGESYCVVLDAHDHEVSQRVSGALWMALTPPSAVDFLFVPDTGGDVALFEITERPAQPVRAMMFLDGQAAMQVGSTYSVFCNDTLRLDFGMHRMA